MSDINEKEQTMSKSLEKRIKSKQITEIWVKDSERIKKGDSNIAKAIENYNVKIHNISEEKDEKEQEV